MRTHTWAALIEADFRLGDRMLYLRSPMTRGDDITDLQQRLGSLGFDAGYVDGIFGPDTESAVRNFQANQGLTPDGVVGPDTVMALGRLAGRRSERRPSPRFARPSVFAVSKASKDVASWSVKRVASPHSSTHWPVVFVPTVPRC